MEWKSRGVLDTPHARSVTTSCGALFENCISDKDETSAVQLIHRLKPFRGAPPQGVALVGPKESEMTDLGRADIRRRDGENVRRDRAKSRAQHFDRGPGRPGIVGDTQRAQRAAIFREIR